MRSSVLRACGRHWCYVLLLSILVLCALSLRPAQAASGINQQINFQGRLLNSQGAVVADGYYNIEFKIYEGGDGCVSGGTSPCGGTAVWTEDYVNNNADQGVEVQNGFLSVQLGSQNPFGTSVDWNNDTLWLSMNVAGDDNTCTTFGGTNCAADGEMLPMKRLSADPYALNSQLLGGLSNLQLVQLGQAEQTDSTSGASIYINKNNASGDLIDFQSSGNDAFMVSNSGDLTFGNNANHTISIEGAASGTAGNNLSALAGAAGSGATALAGGNVTVQAGAGGGTNGNGGNVYVDAGAKNGTGADGTVNIGTNHASAINLGTSGAATNVNGSLVLKNGSNGVTLNNTGSSNYTLTLPSSAPAAGLCLETSPGSPDQLVFASCTNNNASIQEVQEWDANNANTKTVSPTTAGDEMVLTTQIPTSGVTVTSISGAGVTTWNKIVTSAGNGTVNRVEMWAGTVTTTGSSLVTVNYSSSPGNNEFAVSEFTAAGVNSNTSWGIESSASQLNSTPSTTVTFPDMTAVEGSELYIGYAQIQNPPPPTPAGSTSNFSYITTSTQHNIITYDPSLTANTAYQPTASQNSSGESNTVSAIITAFVTSSSINNTTSLQKANFYVQAATNNTVAGVLQAASGGTGDIMELLDSGSNKVLTVGSTGNVTIDPAASSSAVQVLNGSGKSVFAVDNSNNKVILGTSGSSGVTGAIGFNDTGDNNTITLAASSSIASSYTLKLPTNTPTAGLCLGTSPSDQYQLIYASCATQVSAASISYVNKWDSHGTASPYQISDSPASIGNLLVFYSHNSGGATVSGVSGGGVTTWTKITAYSGGGTPGNIEMWRGVVTTAGAGTITVSYSGTVGTYEIAAEEFSMGSANGTWAIDTSGTATTTSSVTTVNYPSLTPANSSELYTGYAYGGGTMSGTCTGAGFTFVATGASKYLAYDTNVTGGTAYAPTCTQTSGVYASIAAVIEAYSGTSVIVDSTATQEANFNVQAASSGTIAGILQAAASGTADIFDAQDSSGNNILSVNGSTTNSLTGLVTGVTLGTAGTIGGELVFAAGGNSNSITIAAPSAPGASYYLTLPTTTPAPGQCLASSPNNANQLVFSSCANQVTSIAISFVNNWKVSTSGLTPSLSVTPTNVGDLMTFFVYASKGNTVTTNPTGCGITWSQIVTANSEYMYRGIVTSTASCSISLGLSTPSAPTDELAAQEWTTGSANGSWVIDSSGTISNSGSSTVSYPNLTPQSTKDLYIGYAVGTSTMSAGSTSGYTYFAGAGADMYGAYNTTVSSGTQPTASQSGTGTSIAAGALIAAYSSSSVISNSTVTQEANFNVQAATGGSVAGVLQAAPTSPGDVLDILNSAGTLTDSFGSTGNLLVEPSTASAAALQVSTGTVNVFSVDTNSKLVVIGVGNAGGGESSPSLLVLDNESGTTADPASEIDGAMYYNATTRSFRCGISGNWQNCNSLLYANTSASSAVNNCSNNCAAFSTTTAIPANYCQAGRVIKLYAFGYFSSQASASNLQFGVYYGTDSSVAANDQLIGNLSPAESVTSASNNNFQLNFNITCFSATAMQSGGTLNLQTGSSAAGMLTLPMSSSGDSGTTVVSSSAKNLYIFPVWDTASSSNTAKLTQFTVNTY